MEGSQSLQGLRGSANNQLDYNRIRINQIAAWNDHSDGAAQPIIRLLSLS